MSTLWEKVEALRGQTLRTVNGKPFAVTAVGRTHLTVVPESTRKPRPIRRQEIESASALGVPLHQLTTARVRQAGASEVNPAYVVAILRHIGAGD